jgi:pyridoxal phosphate enzyme (YggS family)
MTDIAERLESLRGEIARCCHEAGRRTSDVRLLAVSKTKPVADIRAAMAADQIDFGENYLQEAIPKISALKGPAWHFIGSIQSNKTREIAANFHWVHSIESEKVARRLSVQRDPDLGPLNMLIQVNISRETSKSGIAPEALQELVGSVCDLPGISLRGLMAIPAATHDPDRQRQQFAELRLLRDAVNEVFELPEFDQLSMGMTSDFPLAIQEGATWIRIGTAIFGPRN